jgi:hypothetical protein
MPKMKNTDQGARPISSLYTKNGPSMKETVELKNAYAKASVARSELRVRHELSASMAIAS